jgi:hypothetical protein
MSVASPDGALPGLPEDLAAASFSLARRFANGATMWCCSNEWPSHAQHIAVEFVHPVIVGKRALPAAVVAGPGMLDALRTQTRPGDIVVGIARANDEATRSVMRRAQAWGLTTVWIGVGPRPEPGAADFVLWVDDELGVAAHAGRFILLYHLLWELTHVCFEHPGLLGEVQSECTDEVCITCSDEGRLGEVVSVDGRDLAQVRTPAGIEGVDTSLIDPPHPGDLILIHAGSAVTLIEESVR